MKRPTHFVGMLLVTAFWLVGLCLAGFMAMMSPMMFDAGESPALWTIFTLTILFPVMIIVSIALAWVAFGFSKIRLAWWLMAVPLAWAVLQVVAFVTLT